VAQREHNMLNLPVSILAMDLGKKKNSLEPSRMDAHFLPGIQARIKKECRKARLNGETSNVESCDLFLAAVNRILEKVAADTRLPIQSIFNGNDKSPSGRENTISTPTS